MYNVWKMMVEMFVYRSNWAWWKVIAKYLSKSYGTKTWKFRLTGATDFMMTLAWTVQNNNIVGCYSRKILDDIDQQKNNSNGGLVGVQVAQN